MSPAEWLMNYEDIIAAWNNQADKHNQWPNLGEDEKLEWAMSLEREACARVCEVHGSMAKHAVWMAEECAALIRARGNDD